MGQSKAGIQACIFINKKDDDRHGAYSTFKFVQKAIGEVMCGKEEFKSGTKQKQEVIDQLLPSHTKKSVEYSLVASQKSGPKDLDSAIASF